MITGILAAVAIFGVVALTLLLIFRKDLISVDLGQRSLVRQYLYIASLIGVIVTAIGVAAVIDWGAAQLFGVEALYGRPMFDGYGPSAQQYADTMTLRSQTDIIRGVTLIVFGVLIWGGHFVARRRVADGDETASLLHRAYVVLGTLVFGVGTMVLLPVGIYLALSYALITPPDQASVQGFGDSLAGGLVSLPIWLFYLASAIRGLPAKRAAPVLRTAPAS